MNIHFVFGTGSEVRQFLHSGLIHELLNRGHHIFISSRISIKAEIAKAEVDVKELSFYNTALTSGALTRIKKSLDLAFIKRNNYKIWRYNKQKTKDAWIYRLIVIILSIKSIYRLFCWIERKFQFNDHVLSKDWFELIRNYRIDKIVVNVANAYCSVLFAAQRANVPVLLIYHTNKDIYAQGRISFKYEKYGVWNKKMKEQLKYYNPNLKMEQISILGCSHFSYLTNENHIQNISDFNEQYCVDAENDFLVLYTAAGPGIVLNEQAYIQDICDALRMSGINNYKILIRLNPMDLTNSWEHLSSERILILKPKWFYDPVGFFNYTLQEDLREFAALLTHSHVCINIPSTVTVECAIAQIPLINICYNNDYNTEADILKFWNAPFYQTARECKSAIPAFSKKEMSKALYQIYNGLEIVENQRIYLNEELSVNIDNMLKLISDFIE